MSKSAEKMAGKMANWVLQESPLITKSADTRLHWQSVFLPVAEAVVSMEKAVRIMKKVSRIHQHRWEGNQDDTPSEPRPFAYDSSLYEARSRTDDAVSKSLRNIDSALVRNGKR